MDWNSATATDIARSIASGSLTARDVIGETITRLDRLEPGLHSFLSVRNHDDLVREAEAIDRAGTKAGPLAGLPIAVKDNICTVDLPTSCGSRILEGYRSPYDATVVERIRAAGGILIGKANLDEFGMGSSTENSAFGPTRNPWDEKRVPGGSSGGSAAAVSAGQAILALGSDTGGSIRQPAAYSGLVGLKPTYGAVSRYGLVAFASSLDQIGPLGRTVADTALLYDVISGYDPRDSTSVPGSRPATARSLDRTDLKGIKIGIPEEYFTDGLDPEIERAVRLGIEALVDAGAETVSISIPHTRFAISAYYLVADSEASANLARYDGVRYGYRDSQADDLDSMYCSTRQIGFGTEVKRRILIGTYALSSGYYDAWYLQAMKVRGLIAIDFERAFEKCDFLVTPTTPTAAFLLGEKSDDPLAMYLSDIYTISANLAGLPALSVPCGLTGNGLPIGIQFMGKPWNEPVLFAAGRHLEKRLAPIGCPGEESTS